MVTLSLCQSINLLVENWIENKYLFARICYTGVYNFYSGSTQDQVREDHETDTQKDRWKPDRWSRRYIYTSRTRDCANNYWETLQTISAPKGLNNLHGETFFRLSIVDKRTWWETIIRWKKEILKYKTENALYIVAFITRIHCLCCIERDSLFAEIKRRICKDIALEDNRYHKKIFIWISSS